MRASAFVSVLVSFLYMGRWMATEKAISVGSGRLQVCRQLRATSGKNPFETLLESLTRASSLATIIRKWQYKLRGHKPRSVLGERSAGKRSRERLSCGKRARPSPTSPSSWASSTRRSGSGSNSTRPSPPPFNRGRADATNPGLCQRAHAKHCGLARKVSACQAAGGRFAEPQGWRPRHSTGSR